MPVTLSPSIHDTLALLRRRIVRARAARLVSYVVGPLAAAFLALLLVDAAIGVSVSILRAGTFLGLNALVALVAGIVVTWLSPPSTRVLSWRLERTFPQLDERLLSLVHLPADAPGGRLVDALRSETDAILSSLDIRAAYPMLRTRRLAQAAGATLLLAILPTIFWPAGQRFATRFFHAWGPEAYGFTIRVTPPGGYAAQGRPLLIEATLDRLVPAARLPERCEVLLREADGAVRRQAMEPASDGRFAVAVASMPAELSVRVRAGELESDEVRLHGVLPISLVDEGLRLDLTPPAYVGHEVREVSAGAPFSVVQYSLATLRFRVNRPVVHAALAWKDEERSRSLPIIWSNDGLSAAAEIVLARQGDVSGHLTLFAEHEVSTAVAVVGGKVWEDPAPTFTAPLRISGTSPSSAPRRVAPDEELRIAAAVEDPVGLEGLYLECRVADGPIERSRLEAGRERRWIQGEWLFPLAGRVKPGDAIELRIAAVDTRRLKAGSAGRIGNEPLPRVDLGPLTTFEPPPNDSAASWHRFVVAPKAESLAAQTIRADHEQLAEKLRSIRKAIDAERATLEKAARAGHGMPVLTPELRRGLGEARKQNTANQESLRELASQARRLPGVEPLGRLADDLAGRELPQADDSLRQSQSSDLTADRREPLMRQADTHLQSAVNRIDELLRLNEALAQDRLRQDRLELLAVKEEDLARKAADREEKNDAADLRALQEAIARQLEAWAMENPALKAIAGFAEQQRARQLAAEAQRLAQEQRRLADTQRKAREERLRKVLAELAARQETLAGDVRRLDRDLRIALDQAGFTASDLAARHAAHELMDGRPEPALAAQGLAREELDKLASRLDEAKPSSDPRSLRDQLAEKGRIAGVQRSRELAREQKTLEDDLRRLFAEQAKSGAGAGHEELAGALEKLRKEMKELAQKMEGPAAKELAGESAAAAEQAGQAMKDAEAKKMDGKLAEAGKREEEAALQLDIAGKKMQAASDKLAQTMPKAVDEESRLAESVRQTQQQMRQAAQAPAPDAVMNAAQAMRKTAQLAGNQMRSRGPQPGSSPLPAMLENELLSRGAGQAWGDLPGELRARLVQDLRARYGEDYEAIIQRYFRKLAEAPAK